MTLEEYREKYNNIEKTHPAPKGLEFPQTNWHYRKIIEAWQEELPKEVKERIQADERRFAEKMAF